MRERIRNSIDLSCSSPAPIVCDLQRLLYGLPVSLMLLWTWSVFFSSLARGADVAFDATRVVSDNQFAPAPEPIPTDSIKLSPPPRAKNPSAAPPEPIPTDSIKLSPPPRANNPFAAPPDLIIPSPSPRAYPPFSASPFSAPASDDFSMSFPSPSHREPNTQMIVVIVIVIVIMVIVLPVVVIFLRVWRVNQPETMDRLRAFLEDITYEKPVTFTSKQLKAYTNNYSTILGSGGFGKVYLGQLPNGVQCAVKVLQRHLDTKTEEQFKAEVVTIGRTYHANLVRLYGFCYNNSLSALVYEYMSNGSLDKYLFDNDNNNNIQAIGSWEKLYEIALGTAKGMAYLHEECQHRIIHYDIKPANILLNDSFSPKVADFGLAKLCNTDESHVSMTGYRGTPGYSAPEFLIHNFPISYKCDVYSFGMLLFEILGRRKNVRVGANATNSLDWFPSCVWDKYEKGELEELTTLRGIEEDQRERAQRLAIVALWCVQDCPKERPPMSAVVKMLEGGVEILSPPKPFNFMRSIRPYSSMGDSNSITSEETDSNWYKDNTKPKESECEIQIEK